MSRSWLRPGSPGSISWFLKVTGDPTLRNVWHLAKAVNLPHPVYANEVEGRGLVPALGFNYAIASKGSEEVVVGPAAGRKAEPGNENSKTLEGSAHESPLFPKVVVGKRGDQTY